MLEVAIPAHGLTQETAESGAFTVVIRKLYLNLVLILLVFISECFFSKYLFTLK